MNVVPVGGILCLTQSYCMKKVVAPFISACTAKLQCLSYLNKHKGPQRWNSKKKQGDWKTSKSIYTGKTATEPYIIRFIL